MMKKSDVSEFDRRERQRAILGETLKNYRTKAGMTLEEAAQKADISKATISNYENGTSMPPYDVLERLLSAYEVTTFDFLDENSKDYDKDIAVFKKYGFDKGFFNSVFVEKFYSDDEAPSVSNDIAKCLNLIFENPLEAHQLFHALDLLFNYNLIQKISSSIGDDVDCYEHRKNACSVLLDKVSTSLFRIFEYHYRDKDNDEMSLLLRPENENHIEHSKEIVASLIKDAQ